MARKPRYEEHQAREAIAASVTWSGALRRLGMRPAGGNFRTLRRYAEEVWGISTAHFDESGDRRSGPRPTRLPLEQLLVEGRPTNRRRLKERLYAAGMKERRCELCGQGELWQGRRMSLILDHVNGVADDNRLENLRIVCPNCNATLDTHCGRNLRVAPAAQSCRLCRVTFVPRRPGQRYCSPRCGRRHHRPARPRPEARRVERPPHDELVALVRELGWSAVGRRFGVSDNAVRKWVRAYERAASVPADVAADPADRVEVDV
jgi:hypothetical protein